MLAKPALHEEAYLCRFLDAQRKDIQAIQLPRDIPPAELLSARLQNNEH